MTQTHDKENKTMKPGPCIIEPELLAAMVKCTGCGEEFEAGDCRVICGRVVCRLCGETVELAKEVEP